MNKKSIVKKILFYLGILCVVLLGGCCIQILHNPLSGIPQESEDIPVYLENNVLHIGKEKRYIRDLRMYALCLYDDRIYTVYTDYTEDDKFDWYLVSIDIHTKEQKVHSVLKDMDFDYLSYEFRKKYKERNMYYLDGEIVLNDMKQVYIYDLKRQELKTCPYEEYEFPINVPEIQMINKDTIRIIYNGKESVWTLEKMAESSPSIRKLYEIRHKMNWDNDSYLTYAFPPNDIQHIDDKIYVIGQCMNYQGWMSIFILEYDLNEESWKYVTDCYVIDTAHHAQIVPEVT